MQATTRFHNSVTETILQQADLVFDNPEAFHPANGMVNPDADGRDSVVQSMSGSIYAAALVRLSWQMNGLMAPM